MDSQSVRADILDTGDVTFSNSSRENQLWYDELGNEQLRRLKEVCEKLKIDRACYGYGDMVCNWDMQSENLSRNGERLGTSQFMSPQLLTAIRDKDPNYLQSPIDDLFPFYFVSQWAAVFHPILEPHISLMNLRDQIACEARADGTNTIVNQTLREDKHGPFLVQCQPILEEWHASLVKLGKDWSKTVDSKLSPPLPVDIHGASEEPNDLDNPKTRRVFCIRNFLAFAIRGVADLGEILVKQGISIGPDMES